MQSQPMPKFKETLLALAELLFQANVYYGISKALRGQMESAHFERARNFFVGSYYACLREAIISLCKLLIVHPDSASIPSALNYAEQNVTEFIVTAPEVREAIAIGRSVLGTLEATIPKLRRLRDYDLAHLDKRRISDPASLIPSPIEFLEIESCLNESLDILRKILLYYDVSRIEFPEIGDIVKAEFDDIISALGANT